MFRNGNADNETKHEQEDFWGTEYEIKMERQEVR
jgi:hypothetical protein